MTRFEKVELTFEQYEALQNRPLYKKNKELQKEIKMLTRDIQIEKETASNFRNQQQHYIKEISSLKEEAKMFKWYGGKEKESMTKIKEHNKKPWYKRIGKLRI